MRKSIAFFALFILCGIGNGARAEIGIVDAVPAATLLLPHFEVKIREAGGGTTPVGSGLNTLFSINNALDESVLAHVTIWSEWWVPVLGFDVYLTAYDVHTINLYDVIVLGDLPNTGPTNSLSSRGEYSGSHNSFGGSCSTVPGEAPNYANLSGLTLQVIQQSLSGQPRSSDGLCASSPDETSLARGYVTVDTVRACENQHPTHVDYFVDGGLGTATNQNVLWGDYFLIDPANDFAQGYALVHLEADGYSLGVSDGSCDTVDRSPSTFYCSLRNPVVQPGEDNREGLPSVYSSRYLAGGLFSGGTSLLVWRDRNGTGAGVARNCVNPPAALGQQQIVVFDEQENPVTEGTGPVVDPLPEEIPFPWATSRAQVGTDITTETSFGWLFLNLNRGIGSQEYFRQAHVTTVMSALGRFSVGFEAIALNNLTLGADNRRGERNPDPTLGDDPNPNAPTLFDGTLPPP